MCSKRFPAPSGLTELCYLLMYFLEIAKFMHKSYYKALPLSFDEYYSFIDHSHNTRAKSTEALPSGKKFAKYGAGTSHRRRTAPRKVRF